MATIFNERVISGTVNGASVTYTKRIANQDNISVQVKYTGTTITGSVKLQARAHPDADFIDVEDSENSFTDNSGAYLYDMRGINFLELKVVCTSATGDVTFEAWLLIKRPKPTE